MLPLSRIAQPAAAFFFTLFFMACAGPEERLADLQHNFLREYKSILPKAFSIGEGHALVRLPLPPDGVSLQKTATFCKKYLDLAANIPADQLPAAQKESLANFQKQITGLAQTSDAAIKGKGSPADFALADYLEQLRDANTLGQNPEDLTGFLEKIPIYYTLVHENWRQPDPNNVQPAVEKSLRALRILSDLEGKAMKMPKIQHERFGMALFNARLSIKDFIALCQSAVLEQVER